MRLASRLYIVVLATMLPLAAAEGWNSYALHKARHEELGTQATRQAQLAASEVERVLEGVWGISKALTHAPVILRQDIAECSAFLASVIPEVPYITSMATADLSGAVTCSSSYPRQSFNIADRDYFREALEKNGQVLGRYIIGKVNKVPLLPLATVIKTDDGRTVGVMVATLNLGWLSGHLKTRGLAPGGSVTVADRNGTIIARQPNPEMFVGNTVPDQYRYLLNAAEPGWVELTSQDGTRRILGFVPLSRPPDGLYVSAGLSVEDSFAMLTASNWRQFGFWLATLVLSLLGAMLASARFIRRPVEAVTDTLRKLQHNDLSARTGMNSADGELDYIGEQLDDTIAKLQARNITVALLLQELQHRSRNQIALILAMARQIGKNATSVGEYNDALSRRLSALATSHDLLLQSGSSHTDIAALLASQLKVFGLENSPRIDARGPGMKLSPKAARKIGMAFHELLTNAQKYGALSHDDGRILIRWQPIDEARRLYRVEWRERGGPAATPSDRVGFGSLLLDQIIPLELNGQSQRDATAAGYSWTLDFEMPEPDIMTAGADA